jgi:adenosine deaminase
VTLSTDDPGIERIDLTHDYARAVTDYALTHADLKDLVRNSIEYSFLLGAGLWADKGGFSRFAADCGGDRPGPGEPSPPCVSRLAANAKAAHNGSWNGGSGVRSGLLRILSRHART